MVHLLLITLYMVQKQLIIDRILNIYAFGFFGYLKSLILGVIAIFWKGMLGLNSNYFL